MSIKDKELLETELECFVVRFTAKGIKSYVGKK